MLTSKERAELRAQANGLETTLMVGKSGVTEAVVAEAEKQGYKPFAFGMKLNVGDKVYYNNRGKNLYLIRIGKKDVAKNGIRIIASHIDSPRIDLKQVPLYEADGIAMGKTHYYGVLFLEVFAKGIRQFGQS